MLSTKTALWIFGKVGPLDRSLHTIPVKRSSQTRAQTYDFSRVVRNPRISISIFPKSFDQITLLERNSWTYANEKWGHENNCFYMYYFYGLIPHEVD